MSAPVLTLAAAPPAWLADRDPRLRVLAAVAFAAVTVALSSLPVLLLALALAAAMALAAGLGPALLARRLVALEGFMVVVLATLPFTVPGTPLATLGPLTASVEGLERAAAILLRANAIVVMLLALVGTLDPALLGHALARLGVPAKLVHLFLMTARYVGVLHAEYRRLRLAMRARAFTPGSNRHTWRSLGWLLGMLLVRSLERARRVVEAMKCRGFDGRLYLLDGGPWRAADTLGATVAGLLLAGLVALDRLP